MEKTQIPRILLVDDEVAITKSLFRLLKNEGCRIDTCNSGSQALKLLETADVPFSLIISDQRMPEMTGSEFLEKASILSPDAIRFLLTGYSDLQAVADAVNKGKIHRYLTKPWDDEALVLHVRQALRDVEMHRENMRLQALTKRQNKQLYEVGVSLEKKVRERTRELKNKNAELEFMNRNLEESFAGSVRLILSLVETTNRTMGGYLRQVGRISRRVALGMGLSGREAGIVETAGQLHDIGLLGLPEAFLRKSESELTAEERIRYRQHPVFASIVLESVEKLSDIGEMVLHHHENYDGTGFPNGLRGEDIPVGARILAPVTDYCWVLHYWPKDQQTIRRRLSEEHGLNVDADGKENVEKLLHLSAEKILLDGIHKRYDPEVVTIMIGIFRKDAIQVATERTKKLVPLETLAPGMKTSKDLFLKDGRFLLAQGTILDAPVIRSIKKMGEMKLLKDAIAVNGGEK